MSGQDLTAAAAIIAAGGSGSRMGGDLPKQFLDLHGMPILALTISRFLRVDALRTIVVAVPAGYREEATGILRAFLPAEDHARLVLVNGGATRQQSVRAGLMALPPETTTVLVHDGARPFVTSEIIERCLEATEQNGAAITAIPVRDQVATQCRAVVRDPSSRTFFSRLSAGSS